MNQLVEEGRDDVFYENGVRISFLMWQTSPVTILQQCATIPPPENMIPPGVDIIRNTLLIGKVKSRSIRWLQKEQMDAAGRLR